jgi:hypothetical protein
MAEIDRLRAVADDATEHFRKARNVYNLAKVVLLTTFHEEAITPLAGADVAAFRALRTERNVRREAKEVAEAAVLAALRAYWAERPEVP